MNNYKYLPAFLLLAAGLLTGCKSGKDIGGQWYGLKDMSLLSVDFGADGTLTCQSEAMSSMSFTAKYTVNTDTTPMTIDLSESTNGMAGAGIARLTSDGSLEMNIRFGAPGMTERPSEFGFVPQDMTNIWFMLNRDKDEALAPIAVDKAALGDASLAVERNKRLGAGINLWRCGRRQCPRPGLSERRSHIRRLDKEHSRTGLPLHTFRRELGPPLRGGASLHHRAGFL